jgi:hypothetical protein
MRKKSATMNKNDMEKGVGYDKDQAPLPDYYSSIGGESSYQETTIILQSWPTRVIDGFKRGPNLSVTPRGAVGADGRGFDSENAAANTASSPLARELKSRHLQMIAIGGSIGMPACSYTVCRSDNMQALVSSLRLGKHFTLVAPHPC